MDLYLKSFVFTRGKIILFLFGVSLLIALSGFFYYFHEADSIRRQKYTEMRAFTNIKAEQIESWFAERQGDVDAYAKSPALKEIVFPWLKNHNNTTLRDEILLRFFYYKKQLEYDDLFLVDTAGNVLLTTEQKNRPFDSATSACIAKAAKTQKMQFTDLYLCSHHDMVHYDIIGPMLDGNKTAAILVFRRNPDHYLFKLIQKWPVPSKSAETAIIRRVGDSVMFMNPLRNVKNAPFRYKIPLNNTETPSVQAALGHLGIYEGKDVRGVEVLADSRIIPSTSWILITKIDKSEILGDLRMTALTITGFTFLLILVAISVVGLFFNNKEKLRIKESDNRFRSTFNSMIEGVRIIGFDLRYLYINDEAIRQSRSPREDLIGKTIQECFPDISPDVINRINDCLVNKTSFSFLDKYHYEDGTIGYYLTNIQPVDEGALILSQDVTESKEAEEKNLEMARIKRSFLANMNHELRTPLIGIIGFSDIMSREMKDPEFLSMAKSIYSSGRRLSDTINLILNFSDLDAARFQPQVSDMDAVKETADIFDMFCGMASLKNLEYSFNPALPQMPFRTDVYAFRSILSNLLTNAVKYTNTGSVTVQLNYVNNCVELKVIDTGIGIDEKYHSVIFEEFRQASEGFSRHFEGTGLGLSITKGLTEKLNGKISVESSLGKGSVFTVILPSLSKKTPLFC